MVIKFKLDEDTGITWPDGRHIKVLDTSNILQTARRLCQLKSITTFDLIQIKKANFHLDAEGHLVQREHWDDKEVTAVHQIKGDEWIAVIN